VHVVVADNKAEDEVVITVCEPDLTGWDPGFRAWRRA
jgi:hypothetical protein